METPDPHFYIFPHTLHEGYWESLEGDGYGASMTLFKVRCYRWKRGELVKVKTEGTSDFMGGSKG